MSMVKETVPPFTEEEYTRTFQHFQGKSNHYKKMTRMAGKFIVENGFNKKPITMLR